MIRKMGAFFAAVLVWMVVATVVHRALMAMWPAYALATPTLSFSLPMMAARLLLSAVSTLTAGLVCRRIHAGSWLPWMVGSALLVLFLPEHVSIWQQLPVWYHLTFLGSLVPLAVLGARLGARPPIGATPMPSL